MFEKTYPGVPVDMSGMTLAEATEHVAQISNLLPPAPHTLNLGCGPEPENLNEDALCFAASALLSVPAGETLGEPRIDLAQRTGAWFYWRYAGRLAEQELTTQHGRDAALDIIHDDENRIPYTTLRREKFRWVLKERFGFRFEFKVSNASQER